MEEASESSSLINKLAEYFVDSVLAAKHLNPKLVSDYKSTDGYKVLCDYIRSRVEQKKQIKMILPAFPTKSCNLEKVLGDAADYCEFTALERLVSICQAISEKYEPGAHVTIFSDYHTFEKYISVSYENHYKYREGLEKMIDHLDGNSYIKVMSLREFPEMKDKEEKDYQEILRETFGSREFEQMINDEKSFGEKMKESQNGDKKFARNSKGLRSFMLHDQFPILRAQGLNKQEIKEKSIELAKGMMTMGKALTRFLEKYFPAEEYFRLSVHAHSFEGKKFSVFLLPVVIRPKKNMDSSSLGLHTPWHVAACYIAREGKFLFSQVAEIQKGYDVTLKLSEEMKETFKQMFSLLDYNGDGRMDLDEIHDAILDRGEGPNHALYEDIVRAKIDEVLGEESLDHKAFLEVLKKPEAVRLFADLLPAQLSRKHQLTPQQQRAFHNSFDKLKEQTGDTILVTATFSEKPWMFIRLSVNSIGGKYRLSNMKASFLRPGFGLMLEAGPGGLKRADFASSDLDNLRIEFGCVVLRGLDTPFETKDDMLKMAKDFGFPIPWGFGPIHVVKPHLNPKSDVESTKRLTFHFDMCYPPPYMGIDQPNTPYVDYIPGNFWLYCRHAPPEGEGQTTVCDTSAIFRSLDAGLRRDIREIDLWYRNKNLSGEQYYGGADYVYPLVMQDPEKPGREVLRFNELNPKTGKYVEFKSKPAGLKINEEDLQFILKCKLRNPKYTIYHSYKKDDLVFLNNHMTVHGREAFTVAGQARELWRIQIIPKPKKLPQYWEGSILSDAIKEHLEKRVPDPDWSVKLLRESTENDFPVHHNAVLAIFDYMKRSGDHSLWDRCAKYLCEQNTPLNDELAEALSSAQSRIDPCSQVEFSKWCENLLRSSEESELGTQPLERLWVSTLRAASHQESDKLQAYLNNLKPGSSTNVPLVNSTMAAAIDLYAKIGDVDGIQDCFNAISSLDRRSELDRSFISAMATANRLDLALEAALSVGAQLQGKGKARMSLFVGGKPSQRVTDMYSIVIERAIDDNADDVVAEALESASFARIPLQPQVVAKVIAYVATSSNDYLLRFAQTQLQLNADADFPLTCSDLSIILAKIMSSANSAPSPPPRASSFSPSTTKKSMLHSTMMMSEINEEEEEEDGDDGEEEEDVNNYLTALGKLNLRN